MKNRFKRLGYVSFGAFCLLLLCGVASSCSDDYDLDETSPSFLGESIYDELKSRSDRSFQTVVRLIDDLGYADVLSKTRSTTLFVADDAAYAEFFKTTTWKDANNAPVRSYEQLTTSQKRLLLRGAMLNSPYTMEMLANTSGGGKNLCLRRETSSTAIDSIPYWMNTDLPKFQYEPEEGEGENSPNRIDLWSYYRNGRSKGVPYDNGKPKTGMYMSIDNNNPMMSHFLEGQMMDKNITHDDIAFILNQPEGSWPNGSAGGTRSYIYNRMVQEQDVTCLNGYYNVLDNVLVTPPNMAEVIRSNGETNYFSEMLDRFSLPYYDATLTRNFRDIHPTDAKIDSVFVKRYVATNTVSGIIDEDINGRSLADYPKLSFDPGWNTYAASTTISKENDMAAMFVPSDEALKKYFLTDAGVVLMNRYAKKPNTEENLSYNLAQIPLEVIAELINNLMKDSFNETVPSKYLTIMNDAQDNMFPKSDYPTIAAYKGLIEKTLLANNGVVYVFNRVISPAAYASVSAPVLYSNNTKIMNSVLTADESYINSTQYNNAPLKQYFNTYLKAMQSRFSLFVPTDEGLYKYGYVDPIQTARGKSTALYWRFRHANITASGNVPRLPIDMIGYKYNEATGPQDTDKTGSNKDSEKNETKYISRANDNLNLDYGQSKRALMIEMVNQHILVHEDAENRGVYTNNRQYYRTRGNAPLIIVNRGSESALGKGMTIQGGYQRYLELDDNPANDYVATVTDGYDMSRETNGYGNGMTYMIDRPIQPTMRSVYQTIGDKKANAEFSEFYTQCNTFKEKVLEDAGFKDPFMSITDPTKQSQMWTNEQNKFRIFMPRTIPSYATANTSNNLVRFFNNYHYTVYVPTNDAMNAAYSLGLPKWSQIEKFINDGKKANGGVLSDENKQKAQAMIICLVNFLKYHFQDEAFYVDKVTNPGVNCQTQCMDNVTNAYLQINVSQSPDNITLKDESGATVSVNTSKCNLLTRDASIDNSSAASARYIRNSSYAVIHQIDTPLNFIRNFSGRYDDAWKTSSSARKFAEKYRIRK